jgi:hypothetical protein
MMQKAALVLGRRFSGQLLQKAAECVVDDDFLTQSSFEDPVSVVVYFLGAGHGAEAGCSSQSDVDEQRKGYNLITSDYPLSLRGQSDSKPGFLSEWTVGALARVDRTVDRCFCHMYLM